MNYPLFDRSEGFYHALALLPDWEERLARQLDLETFARARLDEAERIVLRFSQLGYTSREIASYYGVSQSGLSRKLKRIFSRMADAAIMRERREESIREMQRILSVGEDGADEAAA
ncbi:MAG TPA: hypothetical protein PKH33_13090 [bacterium]|nr:hypothetical protein [bacterium]